MEAEIITKYFPSLSDTQLSQFEKMGELYRDWNAKINVISRKDIDNLYVNHVLHSLSIAKFLCELQAGTSILDMGTGGGFPGIPLAVMYPQCTFHLIDRIGKKVRVAQDIAVNLGLDNVTFQHGDIGECRQRYGYVVSRAVMALNALVPLISKNIDRAPSGNRYHNGLVCLKGGDLRTECDGIKSPVVTYPVTEFVNDPHFEDKYIVYVPI